MNLAGAKNYMEGLVAQLGGQRPAPVSYVSTQGAIEGFEGEVLPDLQTALPNVYDWVSRTGLLSPTNPITGQPDPALRNSTGSVVGSPEMGAILMASNFINNLKNQYAIPLVPVTVATVNGVTPTGMMVAIPITTQAQSRSNLAQSLGANTAPPLISQQIQSQAALATFLASSGYTAPVPASTNPYLNPAGMAFNWNTVMGGQ